MRIDSKLPDVGTTIFSVMSALAQQHGALNLSQGAPDFDAPDALKARACHYILAGFNQYPPMTGVAPLREQLALQIAQRYGRQVDEASEITVLPGATTGLYCAITALVHDGDEVIIFDPAYDSYEPSIRLAGGKAVRLALRAPTFVIDWQQVRDALSARTRMIIINNPHNPCGTVLTAEDLDTLAEIIRDRDIWVLSDEVYEHLVFDGRQHCSVLAHEELYPRSLAVFSFGKTFTVTGWKSGYVVAPPALSAELRRVHQFNTFVGVHPLQLALADFIRDEPAYLESLPAFYQAKRDRLCAHLQGSRFRFVPTAGTYFQLVEYSAISDEHDLTLAQRLTREAGIATIPLSVFCAEQPDYRYLRLCFAKRDETLDAAGALLCKI